MSLSRLALRLAAVEALCPSSLAETGPYPTWAGNEVFDSRITPIADASEWQKRPSLRLDNQQTTDPTSWFLIAALIALITLLIVSPGFRWLFLNLVLNVVFNSGGLSSSSGGSSSGGGFSGGGGSSGGGGASGSW